MPLATLSPIAFIPTNNPEAARTFYETTLGLTFVSDDNFALVFRIGPTQTMLRVVRTGAFTPAQFTIFGWESPNVTADVQALTARGINFLRFAYFEQDALGIWTAPNGNKVAWFKDPDGNTLSLSSH
jgi:YD repeat-containing protein